MFTNISKAEKIFWGTIVLFMFVFIFVSILAHNNQSKNLIDAEENKEAIIEKYTNILVPSNKVKENITSKEQEIFNSLNKEQNRTYRSIDHEIDKIFDPVYNNVDHFLDYHYSVVGEYVELGTMAFGNINKMIVDKLFGEAFNENLKKGSGFIDKEYKINLQSHLSTIDKHATKGVDVEINSLVLKSLEKDIDADMAKQEIKLTALGTVIGAKIVVAIAAKIGAKSVAKGVAKTGGKLAAKSAAAGTGATIGLACGPFAWVCSPVAAAVLWVATDAVVVTGDELLNRDDFREEIIHSLDESKEKLKNSFKEAYHKSFQEISDNAMIGYQNVEVKETKRVKVIDKF